MTASKRPQLGTLEQRVLEAMYATEAVALTGATTETARELRRRITDVHVLVPNLAREAVATAIGRAVLHNGKTFYPASVRCAGQLAARHRFPRQETDQ